MAGLILLASLLCLLPATSLAAVQGDKIVNSAQFAAGNFSTVTASAKVTVVIRTPSKTEFLKYTPGATATNVALSAYRTAADPAAPFKEMSSPMPAGAKTAIDLTKPVPLASATIFHQGEPIFIRLTDLDQNLDRTRAETVYVTITNDATGDLEVVRLTETGPDTGVFTGYIQSTGDASPTLYSGTLPITAGSHVKASYTDIADSGDISTSSAAVDPFGIVFNSATGTPVDGAKITLIDVATGNPVTVLGDDGVSAFPATVTTGSSVTDSAGRHYDFPPGGFRFPFVDPGKYQFKIEPPAGFTGPSTVPDATLQALPGGPFALVNPGSRLEPFTINPGPAMHIDIPLDPASASIWLQKTAGKDTVAVGDFLPYELDVQNTDKIGAANRIVITDSMPLGFRFRQGSTRINGVVAPDPVISADGRTLTFKAGDLAPLATVSVRYVLEVAAGAKIGIATNLATAKISDGVTSNLAKASVQVRSDFLSSRSVLMGEVINGGCGAPDAKGVKGMEGVRIFLENGTFVDTDKRGMFHFEGITPGAHVVQLDLDSLPKDYQVVPCEENTRFSGSAYSQFVDVQGGSLWRADFHVARQVRLKKAPLPPPPPVKGEMGLELTSSLYGETIVYQLPLQGHNMPDGNLQLSVTLPEGVLYEAQSCQLDGKPITEPAVAGSVLTYDLGSRPGDWRGKLRFRAILPGKGKAGELLSRATLTCAVPGSVDKQPVADNLLRRFTEKNRFPIPEFVLHPHFPTFGAELSDEDIQVLDDLARLLMVLNFEKIEVTGHTDNVRIASRSREVYRDNRTLSLARADSVGRYLIETLHLPPSKLVIGGLGETTPLADNRTDEGRALNRRVEIKVRTERLYDKTRHEILKEKSGIQKAEISDPSYRPKPVAEDEEPDPVKPEEKAGSGITEKEGLLSPQENTILVHSINAVRVCIPVALTPHLFLDGKEVSAERIGFTIKDNKTGKAVYSYIGVDCGKEGEHTLRLQGMDPFGNARFDQSIKVIRSGEITSIRLKSSDGNIADGKTPVKLQLELLDASGRVIPAETDLEIRGGTLNPLKKQVAIPEAEKDKTGQIHVDAAGNALFQPVNTSGPYRTVIGYNKVTLEAETYVKPLLRDWILVGLGEGNIGYNTVSGHMENLIESGQDEHLYENGRIAFFAKGKVKGEWLLTMAYDSAKGKGVEGNRSLFQTIDPNTYYTLYGDATQQQYDAASARKIYLKIERNQFYVLFGDYDTNLTVTELSRYSRRMNGVKAEYQGKNFEANVFGSETTQAYARDEVRGDGTSGIYHLSRKNIVLNSDKITIETRDRFRSEIIINSVAISRFTDYSIDYDTGAIFFKQPIQSRDENFNPIFIVAEYETSAGGSQAYTYGGRVGTKLLDQKLKAGFTYIHEGQVSGDGNSYGLDANYKIMDGTTLKAEVARTDSRFGNTSREGNAYIAELEHHSQKLETKLYFREQDEGFGLGQQNGSETATRKGGVDAAYKITDTISLGGQAYRQYNLSTGGVQDVAEGKTSYTSGPYSAHLGFRYASDKLGDGSVNSSEQVTMGGSWLTLNKRLTLRVDHDQSIGSNNNASFPTRTTFGADFKLNKKVTLFAQEEITSGSGAKTNTTNAGLKTNPWEGGSFNTSMGQNLNENSDRIFALFGLKQTWKITDKWSVDGGVDRSQTIKNSKNYQFNVNVPPASGDNQDFTAVSVGTTYTEKKWNWNNRLEVRTSDSEDKWGVVSAFIGEPKEGWGWSARCQVFDTKSAASAKNVNGDLRLGMVYRPQHTRWIILDRLDFLYDKQQSGTVAAVTATDTVATTTATTVAATSFNAENRRVINNLSANYKLDNKTQISLLYGAKYVKETIDGADYSGFTDLVGVEGRYDLTKKWDIGLRGSVLHSWSSSQISYSTGPSVGYNVIKNAWVSLGYNLIGFTDKDFSSANYTAKGPYVRFRFKFDQNSIKDAISSLNL
jgi:uncharacterized repeat protein (TIGR01451 family)